MKFVEIPLTPMAPQNSRTVGMCMDVENVEYTPDVGMTQRRAEEIVSRLRQSDLGPTNRTYCLLVPAPDATDNTMIGVIVRSKDGVNKVVAAQKYLMANRRLRQPTGRGGTTLSVLPNNCFGEFFWISAVSDQEVTILFAPQSVPQWPVTLTYETVPGTLTPDVDYEPKTGIIAWGVGDDSTKSATIQLLNSTNSGYLEVRIRHTNDAVAAPTSTIRIYKDADPDTDFENPPLTPSPNFIVCPWTFDVNARFHTVLPVNDRLMFFSGKNRGIVFRSGWWYREGLLPPLEAGTLSASGSGYNQRGKWIARWCYVDAHTPGGGYSEFSPESNEIEITDDKGIVFTPPLENGEIPVRDTRFFTDGTESPAFTHWFLYLRNVNSDQEYEVAFRPRSDTNPIAVPPTITTANISLAKRVAPNNPSGVRRVAPSYGLADFDGNRVWKCAGEDIQISASLSLTNGNDIATISGGVFTPDHIGREIVIDGLRSSHFIDDILTPTTARMVNDRGSGWMFATATYAPTGWFLLGTECRVIGSHYGPTGKGQALTVDYEGYPAVNTLNAEFDPQDGNLVVGVMAVPDGLIVAKPNSIFRVSNSSLPDQFLLQGYTVAPIIRGTGLMCHRTLCKDESGVVYMLSSSGPARIVGNVFDKLATQFVKDIIPKLLDFDDLDGPSGAYDVVRNLYLIGGLRRSQFPVGHNIVLAIDKNGGMTIDKYSRNTTCLLCISSYAGSPQGAMIRFDDGGYYGKLYTDGLYVDDHVPQSNWMHNTNQAPTPSAVVARVLTSPYGSVSGRVSQAYWLQVADVASPIAGHVMTLQTQAKSRTSDSALDRSGTSVFVPDVATSYDLIGTVGRVCLQPLTGEALQFRLIWTNTNGLGKPLTVKTIRLLVKESPGLAIGNDGTTAL